MKHKKNIGHHLFLASYCIIVVIPFIWLILGALKTRQEWMVNPAGLPKYFAIENFSMSWSMVNLPLAMTNSLVISLCGTIGVIIAASLASFGVVQIGSKVSKSVYALMIAGLMIPVNAAIIPLFIMVSDLGLLNTRIGIIVPIIAFNIPFAMLLITAWMQNIPDEIFDSGKVDGATSIQLFISLAIPLSLPIFGTIAIISFVNMWNEFLLSVVLLSGPETRTVPLAVNVFRGVFLADKGLISAGVLITIIPVVICYLIFHKSIISGLTEGGIKG